jgi:ribonuclease Z
VLTVPDTVAGFSRAMYSNWLWHKPLQLLVDAGEGLQLALGPRVWAPELVAITHGHADHLLGLPGFIASRRFSKGAQDKPITIVYPAGTSGVETIRDFVSHLWPHEQFPVTWMALRPGDEVPMGRTRALQAFASRHGISETTLGYRVLETRRRLRAEFVGLPESEVRERVRSLGRDAVMDEYRQVVFAHTGDSMPIPPDLVGHADLLVHDATFLDGDERKWEIHATVAEAIEVGRAAGVRCLLLHHLSIRYERGDALPRLRAQVADSGFAGDCWLLDDNRLINLR